MNILKSHGAISHCPKVKYNFSIKQYWQLICYIAHEWSNTAKDIKGMDISGMAKSLLVVVSIIDTMRNCFSIRRTVIPLLMQFMYICTKVLCSFINVYLATS